MSEWRWQYISIYVVWRQLLVIICQVTDAAAAEDNQYQYYRHLSSRQRALQIRTHAHCTMMAPMRVMICAIYMIVIIKYIDELRGIYKCIAG